MPPNDDAGELGALAGLTCTVDELAALVGVEARTVYRHAQREGLPRIKRGVYPLAACVQYYLRKLAEGGGPSGDPELDAERLRLITAQADKVELENAKTRAEQLDADLVFGVLQSMMATCATQLDVLGPRASGRAAGKTAAEVMIILADECNDIRSAITAEIDAFAAGLAIGESDPPAAEANGGTVGGGK